jgi:hypothetical protein
MGELGIVFLLSHVSTLDLRGFESDAMDKAADSSACWGLGMGMGMGEGMEKRVGAYVLALVAEEKKEKKKRRLDPTSHSFMD